VVIGSAAVGGAITVGGTGAQTGTITLGGGTGAQIVNVGTGGTGIKTINIGTSAIDNVITMGTATGAASLTLLSGTGDIAITSVDNVTINGGSAGSIIAIGTNVDGNVINVGTDNTAADTITIGSALDTIALTGAVTVTGNASFTNGAAVYADAGTVDDQCVGDNAVAALNTGNFFTIDMSEGDADCAVTFTGGTAGGIYILNLISGGAFEFTLAGTTTDSDIFCDAAFGANNDSAFVTVRAINATTVNVVSCSLNVDA
jgi:hypothetical protein